MKKALIAFAAAATIVAGAVTTSTQPAQARCIGCAVGAGIVGGAILGAAIANSGPRYAPAPGYVVYEGYGAPYPVSCPGGYWSRRPLYDAYGNRVGWSRPRFICP
ncbi:MAG: hypothetical protein JO205_03450 [Pseudolabrys sp.]|nr:hypothetical protein [Pseudolabrys sp.]MBV9260405.1 hypothetical protein [Pseudolabrys sp.]